MKKKLDNGGKNNENLSPEEREKRAKDASARVAGIEALLRDAQSKLQTTESMAAENQKKFEQLVTEKNAVERMLEEMERKKEAAEEAAIAAQEDGARLYDENNQLMDKVTTLHSARAADHASRAVTTRKWRNELATFEEKTPEDFLNELLTLVKDMDNDVEIELMDAETAAKCASGGIRLARGEELSLCDEWTHNPTLAMARPDKLARLASKMTIPSSDANGASASFEAQVDIVARKAKENAAAIKKAGASGVEVKITSPMGASKRRAALGAVDANVVAAALAASADASVSKPSVSKPSPLPEPVADALIEPHYVDCTPSHSPATSPMRAKLSGNTRAERVLMWGGAGDKGKAKAGFSASASVDVRSLFNGSTGTSTPRTKKAAQKHVMAAAGFDVFSDFDDVAPVRRELVARE